MSSRSADRQLTGVLGAWRRTSDVRRAWNAMLKQRAVDGFMDAYPASERDLPARLGEMFHFDRRGYAVGPLLRSAVMPLLDELDDSARERGMADLITNRGGVLGGSFVGIDEASIDEIIEQCMKHWF